MSDPTRVAIVKADGTEVEAFFTEFAEALRWIIRQGLDFYDVNSDADARTEYQNWKMGRVSDEDYAHALWERVSEGEKSPKLRVAELALDKEVLPADEPVVASPTIRDTVDAWGDWE